MYFEKSIREVESEYDYLKCSLTLDVSRDCEHACIRWKGQHALLLNICIAMAALELPPYVLLFIVDFIDTMWIQSHHQKINLIYSVKNSIERVVANRAGMVKTAKLEN